MEGEDWGVGSDGEVEMYDEWLYLVVRFVNSQIVIVSHFVWVFHDVDGMLDIPVLQVVHTPRTEYRLNHVISPSRGLDMALDPRYPH